MIQRLIITLATIATTLAALADDTATPTWKFTDTGAKNVYTRSGNAPNYSYNAVNKDDVFNASTDYFRKNVTSTYTEIGDIPTTSNSYITVGTALTWAGGDAKLYAYTVSDNTSTPKTIILGQEHNKYWQGISATGSYCVASENNAETDYAVATTGSDGITTYKYYNIVSGEALNSYVSTSTTYTAATTLYARYGSDVSYTYRKVCDAGQQFTPDANLTYCTKSDAASYVNYNTCTTGSESVEGHLSHLGYIKTTTATLNLDTPNDDGTYTIPATDCLKITGTLTQERLTALRTALSGHTNIIHYSMQECQDEGKLAASLFTGNTAVEDIILPASYAELKGSGPYAQDLNRDEVLSEFEGCTSLAVIAAADLTVNADGTKSGPTRITAHTFPGKQGSIWRSTLSYEHFPELWYSYDADGTVSSQQNSGKVHIQTISATGPLGLADIRQTVNGVIDQNCEMIGEDITNLDLSRATYVADAADPIDADNVFKTDKENGNLEEIRFPEGITGIPNAAYRNCHKLHSVGLPSTLLTIGDDAFNSIGNLSAITFPAGLTRIGSSAFSSVWIKDIYFLSSTVCPTLGNQAFTNGQTYNSGNLDINKIYAIDATGHLVRDTNGDPLPAVSITKPDLHGLGSSEEQTALNNAKNAKYQLVATHDLYTHNSGSEYASRLHLNPDLLLPENATILNQFTDPSRQYGLVDDAIGELQKWPTHLELDHIETLVNEGKNEDGSTFPAPAAGDMSMHAFALVCFNAPRNTGHDFDELAQGLWWTVFVQFPMSKQEVLDTFGKATNVCKFNKVDRTTDTDGTKHITLYFTHEVCQWDRDGREGTKGTNPEPVIEAWHPYMIHPSAGDGDPDDFITKNFPHPVYADKPAVTTENVTASDGTKYTFKGIAMDNMKMPQYCYYLGKTTDTLHEIYFNVESNPKRDWKQFCAIVTREDEIDGTTDYTDYFSTASAKQRAVATRFGDDYETGENTGTTGVEHVTIVCGSGDAATVVDDYYTLDGRRLPSKPDRKGIYIHGGHKQVVR